MITAQVLRLLRQDIDKSLTVVGKQHGLSLKTGNATYTMDGKTASFRLEVTAEGTSITEINLKKVYPEYAGKLFDTPQGRYIITGLNSRGTSFLINRVHDNKGFTMRVSAVRFYLDKEKALAKV